MSVVVVGGWELSWNSPIKETELWDFVLRDFGVESWWMWPVSGIRRNPTEDKFCPLVERPDAKTILEENSDRTHVYVAPHHKLNPHKGTDLRKFEHPERALYIFGTAHFNPMVVHYRNGIDLGVTIPTVRNDGVLWPHQCLTVLLYDRLVKGCR